MSRGLQATRPDPAQAITGPEAEAFASGAARSARRKMFSFMGKAPPVSLSPPIQGPKQRPGPRGFRGRALSFRQGRIVAAELLYRLRTRGRRQWAAGAIISSWIAQTSASTRSGLPRPS
ncbi:hypothetical protein GCM10008966_03630 [Rhodovulum strictum]